MKKVIILLLTLVVLLTAFVVPTFAQDEIKVTLNGGLIKFPDMKPIIINGRTLVPARAILEKMGLEVSWDGDKNTVIGKKEGLVIKLPINKKYASKNGEEIELDVPATIIEGRTMVPVRFIAESADAQVFWDNSLKMINIVHSGDDLDTDKDGLSDFQEKYKYYTDPNNPDSDGDGILDSEWNERREYTYTLKVRMQITGPWDIDSMNNDYQDTRILEENENYAECEVVFYTENTVKEGIRRNENWGNYGSEFNQYLKPYIYANWDEEMRSDLIEELKQNGIYPDKLSDRDLVQEVSMWIRKSTEIMEYKHPAQFYLKYDENGNFYIDPRFKYQFENYVKSNKNMTLEEILNKQVLGKEMYYNKARGGCTSSTTYAATIYRALGIPTRHVLTTKIKIPANQINKIQNPLIKETIIGSGNSSSNHTYNEVYIDGRWTRIDYDEFGFGSIKFERGLKYQHYSPNDFSEIDMSDDYGSMVSSPTWGPFRNGEFFKLLDISDSYGKYYKPHYEYGIDPTLYDFYYVFGEKGFYPLTKVTVLNSLQKYRNLERGDSGSILEFKEEYLKGNNIVIVSANTEFHRLPDILQSQITRDEYEGLEIYEYKTIKIDQAIVLFVKL